MLESIVSASQHPFQIDGTQLQHSMPEGDEGPSQTAHMDLRHLLQVFPPGDCCCQASGPHDLLNVWHLLMSYVLSNVKLSKCSTASESFSANVHIHL